MAKTVFHDGDEGVELIVQQKKDKKAETHPVRDPAHVVYGGAHLFRADTPAKLGTIAIRSVDEYAPSPAEFASAMGFRQAIAEDVYGLTRRKLETEPVEDFRIDFEDGFGFRPDDEEDFYAVAASNELAEAFNSGSIASVCGIRVKSFGPETYGRAVHTLKLFVGNLIEKTGGTLPSNFVVTLPKVSGPKEVQELCRILKQLEKDLRLDRESIGVELMIETPSAILNDKGRCPLPDLVRAARGRCNSVHFGAYDYTSALGISAAHQHLRHDACNFARQMMLASLAPMGIRLSDSVTTLMPVPLFKGNALTGQQQAENTLAVHRGWREHFANVTYSIANGFYQSWDLHPHQLPARYAAVYAFYHDSKRHHAARLRSFIDRSTQASLTGNAFDDAASARGLVSFFKRGVSSGAFADDEIKQLTGMPLSELNDVFRPR